ncbi:MAG: AraC family transcriptional regulator [Eubacteriales bacterium]|nr:AraC family transcriptional regulator [Eubacteriales bacterium]
MDEQIIRILRQQALEERKYISEKYGRGDGAAIPEISYKDYAVGRQSAAVRLYDGETEMPFHGHNYVEMMYVYKGCFTHEIDGEEVTLKEGDVLLMNRYSCHEVKKAGPENIGFTIMAVPEFFEKPLQMQRKQSPISDLLLEMLRRNTKRPQHLVFQISGRRALESLMENLIESIMEGGVANEEISQYTMGLLFLYVSENMGGSNLDPEEDYKDTIIQETRKYIEIQYRTARLGKIAEDYHIPLPSLSKLIKEGTGSTFQELLMKQRFEKAAMLLLETNLPVEEIALNVGYENQSYFHRQFKMRYGLTPRRYRLVNRRKMRQQQ